MDRYVVAGNPVHRAMQKSIGSSLLVDKGNHRHFMAKEIAEQPEVIGHTLAEYVDFAERAIRIPAKLPFDFKILDRITITACGRFTTMPAKMIRDMPLPIPRSVICSPSHMMNVVPVVSVSTVISRKAQPGL